MEEELRAGTVLAGLTIRRKLGSGGFGITYLAEDNDTRVPYALKEYFPTGLAMRGPNRDVAAQPAAARTFERGLKSFFTEAGTLRSLPGVPGLVGVRGVFTRNGTAYCVMEFVDGESLDRILDRCEREGRVIPESWLADFVVAIAEALGTLHAARLIHRDIKPANVMIRRSSGQPVLIDFGAARRADLPPDDFSTLTGQYAPIEQMRLDWDAQAAQLREGPWTDIFALSVMLYRMAAGERPPDAQTRLRALRSGGDCYVPLARKLRSVGRDGLYSSRLTDLIDHGAGLFPAQRPADAKSFARPLREERSVRSWPARPASDDTPTRVWGQPLAAPVPTAKGRRRRWRWVLPTVLVCLALAAADVLSGGVVRGALSEWVPR